MRTILKPLLLIFILCTVTNEIYSQTKLSVQGVIRLSDGNAIEDGLYPITFKLYNTNIGGSELWEETQAQLKVTSGIYSTILGEVTPLDLSFDEFYYLSLTVEGEELLPRAPLTSAPYSNSVLGFDNVFPSTGNIGVGTLNPTEKLEVNGGIKADSLEINGDIQANAFYTPYKGTYTFGVGSNSSLPTGISTQVLTTAAMPASMVGQSKAIVIANCSETGAGQPGVNILRANTISTTQIQLVIENVGSQSYRRINWIIFPL